MAIDFTGDDSYWDNPEAVTLVSVATSGETSISISRALRLPLTTREMQVSNGVYTSQDCKFLIPGSLVTAEQSPRPRWRIQAANEYGVTVDWTILDRSYSTLTDVFRCTCRDLVLVADLRDSIDVMRPTNSQNAAGIRVPVFDQVAYAAIPAKIQEIDSEESDAHGKLSWKKKYVCYVGQDLTVTVNDQVRSSGVTYQIKGYRNPASITELFTMDLEILP